MAVLVGLPSIVQWLRLDIQPTQPGLYARVIREGVVKAGDKVSVEKYIGQTISILQMYRDHYAKELSEDTIRRHLKAPIDIRSRKDLEEELHKLLT